MFVDAAIYHIGLAGEVTALITDQEGDQGGAILLSGADAVEGSLIFQGL